MKLFRCPEDNAVIRDVIGKLDYSAALVPEATQAMVRKACREAVEWGYAAVAVFPSHVPWIIEELKGTKVLSQIALGFPCGDYFRETKLLEAKMALEMGIDEIDMVLNIGRLKDGDYAYVEDELAAIKDLARPQNVVVKAIMEIGLLTDDEKKKAADICIAAGLDFIKTCTGFGPGRATIREIAMLRAHVGDKIRIKASGGVASLEDGKSLLDAGADRIAGRYMFTQQLIDIGYRP